MAKKHIDALREARLWVGQIIVPAITLAATVRSANEVKRTITAVSDDVKGFIDEKIKGKEAAEYYTQKQWNYIQEVVRRRDRNELTESEWSRFKSEWMV
jgi:heterodisulfide reductase subunit A-like polyferredoxin